MSPRRSRIIAQHVQSHVLDASLSFILALETAIWLVMKFKEINLQRFWDVGSAYPKISLSLIGA